CMSTRSSSSSLVPPFIDPDSVIRARQRNLGDPLRLLDFEEISMSNNLNINPGPPPTGPPPQNHNGPPGPNLHMPAPDLRTMEELCQPTMNGRGGSIALVNIQATDFGLRNHMIQQIMKQNGVTDDALRLYLFPYSLTHHATTWFDRLLNKSIHTFQEMASKFLSKYSPPSMVTKLWNNISNFRQLLDESLFEAWERYNLSIIASLAHQMVEMQKDMLQMFWQNQQVNSVTPSCETCGAPHSYYECHASSGYTQDVYATTGNYNSCGNTYQPRGDRNRLSYRFNNFLGPPGFNNQNQGNN
ncbi:reverse transcriptase domain-containing protein, partial [Tanacetum coccineum]